MRAVFILLLTVICAAPALAAGREDNGTINIMAPEPGVATHRPAHRPRAHKPRRHRLAKDPKGFGAKQDTRRGSSVIVRPTPLPPPTHYRPPASTVVPQPRSTVPSQLYVPQTGRTLPNLPSASGSGPHGAETFGERAARCAHQAGMYGAAAGDRAAYINTCVNQ